MREYTQISDNETGTGNQSSSLKGLKISILFIKKCVPIFTIATIICILSFSFWELVSPWIVGNTMQVLFILIIVTWIGVLITSKKKFQTGALILFFLAAGLTSSLSLYSSFLRNFSIGCLISGLIWWLMGYVIPKVETRHAVLPIILGGLLLDFVTTWMILTFIFQEGGMIWILPLVESTFLFLSFIHLSSSAKEGDILKNRMWVISKATIIMIIVLIYWVWILIASEALTDPKHAAYKHSLMEQAQSEASRHRKGMRF